jgi:cytochrome c oxidase accessory protein FixG
MNGSKQAIDPVQPEGFGPVDLYQRRERIYTRFVGGFFQRLRFFTGWPLLLGYFALPWVHWQDRQAILFDLPARQFHIASLTFFPQDLWLLGWVLIIAAFGLFMATTLVGRLWCGYTCPQTVWTAIFMWMEQVAEGPRHQRIRLANSPWSLEKLRKRLAKHSMWLGWAGFTGFTFIGYFTPIRDLVPSLWTQQANPWVVFWGLFFTAATYINAGWLREQVCIYMCPYARFQSALFDRDTLIVSYDRERGEPRGSQKRRPHPTSGTGSNGDCVDCQMCVQVCPVGIDIRDGLQYQCIGCAHCIDACDQVMDKMNFSRGLVSYTTESKLAGQPTRWLRPRSVGYGVVLTACCLALVVALFNRQTLELDIVRQRGELAQRFNDTQVMNQYSLQALNKTQRPQQYSISVSSSAPITIHRHQQLSSQLHSSPGEIINLPLTLMATQTALSAPSVLVNVELCDTETGQCDMAKTTFFNVVGP